MSTLYALTVTFAGPVETTEKPTFAFWPRITILKSSSDLFIVYCADAGAETPTAKAKTLIRNNKSVLIDKKQSCPKDLEPSRMRFNESSRRPFIQLTTTYGDIKEKLCHGCI